MSTRDWVRRAAGIVLAIALGVSACGDDDDVEPFDGRGGTEQEQEGGDGGGSGGDGGSGGGGNSGGGGSGGGGGGY